MSSDRLGYLFRQNMQDLCSPQEQEELQQLLNNPLLEATARRLIQEALTGDTATVLPRENATLILQAIFQSEEQEVQASPTIAPVRRRWLRYTTAAAIITALIAGSYFWHQSPSPLTTAPKQNVAARDIAPGGDRAMLTLADGTTIALDSAANGTLTQQGNATITKSKAGQLIYTLPAVTAADGTAAGYNRISTPRGGQYQVILPDGSKVWLNATSSLSYPIAFAHNDRTVELTGEAYFEIAHDVQAPFRVKTRNQEILVLGTAFNLNAYEDEASINTTLLNGSVKIDSRTNRDPYRSTLTLTPGQQAQLYTNGSISLNPHAHVEEIVAWKNGLFQFQATDLSVILRQIARWYDIDIVYAGPLPSEQFTGEIPRNRPLSEVLQILKLSKVHFKIEGRTLTVIS